MTPEKPKGSSVPETEPERSRYYMDKSEIKDLKPNTNAYDARLVFAKLWRQKYNLPYTFTVNTRAKTPQGQVGRELATMRSVLSAHRQSGIDVIDLIRAYLQLDDRWLKDHYYPMGCMANDINLPRITAEAKHISRAHRAFAKKPKPPTAPAWFTELEQEEAARKAAAKQGAK